MNPKPKLGLIAVAKTNHFKGEINEFLRVWSGKLAAESGIEAVVAPRVLFDEREIVDTARTMEQDGADLIVFVVGTWIFSSHIISAVNDLHTPFVLYGLSHEIANGNFGASLQIRYVLQEMGKRFLYLAGRIDDEANYAVILKYARAAWVRSSLRNRKLATIGGKCMMMYQTQVNEFNWKSVFGIDFPQYDTVQVFKEMESVDPAEAQAVADRFAGQFDAIHWEVPETHERIEQDAILSQARMYLAFKRLQKLYGIDFFANKCMPEMSAVPYGYGYAGCLATCMLNEDNIMTACEADVPAALSMFILNLLTGQKVFFADIARLNKPANKLTFFNCGTAPISLADRSQGVALWPIPGNIMDEAVPSEYAISQMKGTCIGMVLPPDRQVTLLRVGGNDDTLRFHVGRATTAGRDIGGKEDLGNRWPGFGLTFAGDLDTFLRHTVGHHYSIVFGDWVEELGYLAQVLGIKFEFDE